jgi:hypothetical protein
MGLMSIAGMVLMFGLLLGLLALVAAPIVIALFLVGLVLKVIFFVLLLPFRLVGGLFGAGFSVVGWLLKGVLVLLGAGLLTGARNPPAPSASAYRRGPVSCLPGHAATFDPDGAGLTLSSSRGS